MASHQCSIFSAYLILLICPVKNGGITIAHDDKGIIRSIAFNKDVSTLWPVGLSVPKWQTRRQTVGRIFRVTGC
ncbi:hypothetical protein ACXH7K_005751, partial [Klebsiella variicola]